jgi:hypothetical protein
MQHFIEKYGEEMNGVLTGFDRLVLRGSLRRLNFGWYESGLNAFVAKGIEEYLWQNKIPFKTMPPYYRTCGQSEWATDIVFREAGFLKRLMPPLVRDGMLSFGSPEVMRYFGRKVNLSGAIPGHFGGTLKTGLQRRQEGERVQYQMNGNPAKFSTSLQ